MNYKIDYKGLKKFLETLTYRGVKDGALVKAHARNDIDFFYKTDEDKRKISLNQVIEYGQPFLVDSVGNDLSVAMLTKSKHKNHNGRLVQFIHLKTLIKDCDKLLGSCVNGYWIIPDKFILWD